MLKLTFLGTSSGTPTRQRNVSGLAVQSVLGADWFLVDCGEGTQHRLQQTPLSLNDMAAVCITHVHGDHCYGLPGLLASAGMGRRSKPLKLIAPLPVREWFEATRRLTDLHLPYEVEHVDVESRALVYGAPGLRIERHVLRHRVPSHAYRVQVETRRVRLKADALRAIGLPPGPAWRALQGGEDVPFNGTVLRSADFAEMQVDTAAAVLGGDNADPALLYGACQGAQLLVHEATYTQEVLDKVGPGPMHSSARLLAEAAQAAGVPNLVLTHLSPRHQNAEGMAALVAETQAHYRGNAFLANDLDVFELDGAGKVTVTHA
ncbi:MBL fold metallo-hydrolase [Variovorax sp. Root318D1]|uniref:ribonuclease Z n=1 Tax=Variovorax sp. Root318D1 TaxID=1736513 RepID=UPI0006FC5D7B|nr:ribonuclease Z [Variovorax sp. Root318D1]KQU85017.1 MBL fold metallo-hydrolase [Variovorax sp. Root318D1]